MNLSDTEVKWHCTHDYFPQQKYLACLHFTKDKIMFVFLECACIPGGGGWFSLLFLFPLAPKCS